MGDPGQTRGRFGLWLLAAGAAAAVALAWLAPRSTDASPTSADDLSESVQEPSAAALPPVLLLLDAENRPHLDADALAAAIGAADELHSVRGLVAIAERLDPELVTPDHAPTVWLALGRAHERDGDYPEARLAYEQVAKGHWAHARACLGMGRILAQLGELEGARTHFQEAIEAGGPTETAARLALADAFLADGKPDQAIRTWRRTPVRSATYDMLRIKTKRLSVRRHKATWGPLLAHTERLAKVQEPYRAAVVAPNGVPPVLRQRLLADPSLIEIEAERKALEALPADPEVAELMASVRERHRRAGNAATQRALDALATEIRRANP